MNLFQDIPPDEKEIIYKVAAVAKSEGVECYAVGGYVRDKLLQRPTKDIDFVCIGSGIDFAMKVARQFEPRPQVSVFKNFGTAMFRVHDIEVEFVGARKESYSRNSRKPVVEEGTLQDDQNRRDFTINALAVSLNEHNFGEIIDSFGGIKDLDNKIIRTPLNPDITFSDDPLRMMRAIRFATQLHFIIEEKTYQSIKKNKERIRILSHERITDELNKIILAPVPSIGFRKLFDTGLLHIIFPEMADLSGTEYVDGKGHKDNFFHTLQVLDNVAKKSDDLWLRWAAILHDIGKPATKRFDKRSGWTFHGHEVKGAQMVKDIFKKFKLPMNQKMRYVEKLVLLHLRPIALNKKDITDSAIRRLLFEAGNDIDDLMILCEADITTKDAGKMERYLKNFEIVRIKLREVEAKDKIRNMQPPISGEEIMQYFGLKPSPVVGKIKNAIKDAILDGKIGNNREEAFNFMLDIAAELGLIKK
jgi:putative nucleotidyltransferase with HDIG domain